MRARAPNPNGTVGPGERRPLNLHSNASERGWLRFALAGIPFAALTVGACFVNRVEPRILGLPFLLFWIVAWVVLVPAFLWTVGRLERRW